MVKLPTWVPYLVAVVSTVVSLLLGMVAWFVKRELTTTTTELSKVKDQANALLQQCSRCPAELRLWVQQSFVTQAAFDRQGQVVQENIIGFRSKLQQIDTNLAFLVKMSQDEQ